MKLSTREDVLAPRETVFQALSDFARIEDLLRDKGIDVTAERGSEVRLNDRWVARYSWRARAFKTEAQLTRIEPGKGYSVESLTDGVSCMAEVDVLELSATRSRIFASLDFRPTSLSSRLLLQSLKLAKPRLDQKFKERVARFAATIPEA